MGVTSATAAVRARRSVPGITVRRVTGTTTRAINDRVEAAAAAAVVAEAATEEAVEIMEEAPATKAVTTVTGVAAPAGTAAVTTTTVVAVAVTTGGTSKMWLAWCGVEWKSVPYVPREAAGSL